MSEEMSLSEIAAERRADQPDYDDELVFLQQEWDDTLSRAIDLYNVDTATRDNPKPIELTYGDSEWSGVIRTDVTLEFNGMEGDPLALAERLEKLAALIRIFDRDGVNLPGVHPTINPNDSH